MLTIYRRHKKDCPHRSRSYRRCRCPLWVQGTLAGEVVRRSMDLTAWEAAQEVVHEWTVTGRIGGKLGSSMSVPEAVERYIADVAARKLAVMSIYRYNAFLKRVLVPWCEKEKIKEVRNLDFATLSKFRASWTTWSSYTSAKNLELLRMFLRFCVNAKWTEENAAAELKSPKIKMAPTLPFTEDEEEAILAACDLYRTHNRWGKTSPERLRTFVLTLRYSGLRIGDVSTLETKRLKDNSLLLYTHKTGVAVYVPIPPFVADALRVQASLNSNGEYFFWTGASKVKCVTVTWQRTLSGLFKKAGVIRGYAHRFRDTFAVSLLLAGVSVEDVATLLGHSSTAITEKHYAPWVAARQERLEAAVAKTWKVPQTRLRLVKA
jgi:integrase/recombinase XerD